MTSETDELRRMLDERGVEWEARDGNGCMFTYWTTQKGAFSYFARESEQRYGTDELLLETTGSTKAALVVTAEQAIAATLGSEGGERMSGNANDHVCDFCEPWSNPKPIVKTPRLIVRLVVKDDMYRYVQVMSKGVFLGWREVCLEPAYVCPICGRDV